MGRDPQGHGGSGMGADAAQGGADDDPQRRAAARGFRLPAQRGRAARGLLRPGRVGSEPQLGDLARASLGGDRDQERHRSGADRQSQPRAEPPGARRLALGCAEARPDPREHHAELPTADHAGARGAPAPEHALSGAGRQHGGEFRQRRQPAF